jgi:epoxyqueuosine reductase
VCPWNRYARAASHPDLKTRHALDAPRLTELFGWSPAQFEERMQGSAIYRIGYERWLRNIAVALGNAPATAAVRAALLARRDHASAVVREHVGWALARHEATLGKAN